MLAVYRGDKLEIKAYEFENIQQKIVYECEQSSKSQEVIVYFETFVSTFLTKELIPYTESKSLKHMMRAFVKCWTDFIMFAELMD